MLLNDYITSQGRNCILGNVYNTMNFYKLQIKEQDLFFWFSPFNGDRTIPEVFKTIYNNNGSCEKLEFLKKSIMLGHPVMISINPDVLPYIDMRVGDNTAKHYINIIGIDEKQKRMFVSDSYVPKYIPTVYEGWVDYSQINDSDISHCWCIKEDVVEFFRNSCSIDEINTHSVNSALKRIQIFLKVKNEITDLSGMDEIVKLRDSVTNNILNENYENMYILLAGIRLNIINPLIYLQKLLERFGIEYEDLLQQLDNLIIKHWESLNVKFIKFALAHKKPNIEIVSQMIEESTSLEIKILNNILTRLQPRKTENIDAVFQKMR